MFRGSLMKNIRLLDCTLRDGGRLIDCEFTDYEITEICRRLANSNIDVIEVGFIRDAKKVYYEGGSTFFTDVNQISRFLPKATNKTFVAFIDYGMFNFDTLRPCDSTSVTGLRVGFTKKNFDDEREEITKVLKSVKEKGYQLFVQGVNSLAYSEYEMRKVLDMINEVKPYSFGIVDTYGAMYPDDLDKIFQNVDSHLDDDIALDFHAHNNKQMALALALDSIDMCNGSRTLILDGTLEGMGKCAGNLNTELIVDYLNTKLHYNYDFDEILDLIDEFIRPVAKEHSWGYSIPALLGGMYKSHPNNLIYLFSKFRLSSRDFKNILSMIDPQLRQTYDYDNIDCLYREYSDSRVDDSEDMAALTDMLKGKKVLVESPGQTLISHPETIIRYVKENNPVVITVNFTRPGVLCFCSNKRRYEKLLEGSDNKFILASNVSTDLDDGYIVNYGSLIDRRYEMYDNSVMMLLSLLRKTHVSEIAIAGFDGYYRNKPNYMDESFDYRASTMDFDEINRNVSIMVNVFVKSVEPDIKVKFITPSKYSKTEVQFNDI